MTKEEIIARANRSVTDAFEAGAEWEHKRLVEKACEWLERNIPYGVVSHERVWDMVQEFRKAMEERL